MYLFLCVREGRGEGGLRLNVDVSRTCFRATVGCVEAAGYMTPSRLDCSCGVVSANATVATVRSSRAVRLAQER
jgi:hypothetical protein